jgi:hypothetical protein
MTEHKAIRTDTAAALRAAGLRDKIHPLDAFAFTYPDRAYFEASAKRDREIHRNDVHGPFETAGGLLGIVDIRPQEREHGWMVTDPALPDDYAPATVRRPRDFSGRVDGYGNIAVDVKVRRPGDDSSAFEAGASADPVTVARFLRGLADDVEVATGEDSRS